MYYLRIKADKANRRWKVREAVSVRAAINCVIHAMTTGSVGGKDKETTYDQSVPFNLSKRTEIVLADVVRVNSDNSEVTPS